ncbi:hypothetical protein ACLKA6_015204 [Drosophila palustris]
MVIPGPDPTSAVATSGFNRTPLTALSAETRSQLACMLSRKKVLHSEQGYERDWRGIATLAGLRNYVDDNVSKPMDLVLSNWIQHKPKTAEVGHLEDFLGIIDRWDVLDDIQENLTKDTERYNQKQHQQEQLALALARNSPPPDVALKCVEKNNNSLGRPVNILGIDDERCLQNGLPLPKYNACVLYAEADIELATDIMKNLESPRYNLKLFLKHRDLALGVPFEHVELTEFMKSRCNHLIVVLTQEFLNSRENTFLVNFTQKLQIQNNLRKIIPVLYCNMTIPQTLAIYTHLNFSHHSVLFNFWDRLAGSLYDVDAAYIYSSSQQLNTPTAPEAVSLPSPGTPRITINGEELTDQPDWKSTETKSKSKSKVKAEYSPSAPLPLALPEQKIKKRGILENLRIGSPRNGSSGKSLKHAQSFSAINMPDHDNTLNASMSNLSTYSEKKKRFTKISSKLLKPFTRSSTKLQTLC